MTGLGRTAVGPWQGGAVGVGRVGCRKDDRAPGAMLIGSQRPQPVGGAREGGLGTAEALDELPAARAPAPSAPTPRTRSAAPGRANWAPPSPSTKYPRRALPRSSNALSNGYTPANPPDMRSAITAPRVTKP